MDSVLFKASPDLEPEGGRFPGLGEGGEDSPAQKPEQPCSVWHRAASLALG